MKKILLSAMLLAAITSCSKSETERPVNEDGLAEIVLSSGVVSKAIIEEGVAIEGLQFVRIDGTVMPTDFSTATLAPITGSRAGGAGAAAITFANKQHYSATNHSYFTSYYPQGTYVNGVVKWVIDGKTDILSSNAIDAGTNAAHTSISPLAYRHELAQIAVVCKAEDATAAARWGKIQSIKLKKAESNLLYSLASMTATAGNVLSDIALLKGETYELPFLPIDIPTTANTDIVAAGMFAPSASQQFTLEVETEKEGVKILTIDLGNGKSLVRGKRHTATLTFKNVTTPEVEIGITASIEAWQNDGASGEGEFN